VTDRGEEAGSETARIRAQFPPGAQDVASVREEFASGRLVLAIDRPVTSEYAYYLVQAAPKADLRCLSVFRDWLVGQCASR